METIKERPQLTVRSCTNYSLANFFIFLQSAASFMTVVISTPQASVLIYLALARKTACYDALIVELWQQHKEKNLFPI